MRHHNGVPLRRSGGLTACTATRRGLRVYGVPLRRSGGLRSTCTATQRGLRRRRLRSTPDRSRCDAGPGGCGAAPASWGAGGLLLTRDCNGLLHQTREAHSLPGGFIVEELAQVGGLCTALGWLAAALCTERVHRAAKEDRLCKVACQLQPAWSAAPVRCSLAAG